MNRQRDAYVSDASSVLHGDGIFCVYTASSTAIHFRPTSSPIEFSGLESKVRNCGAASTNCAVRTDEVRKKCHSLGTTTDAVPISACSPTPTHRIQLDPISPTNHPTPATLRKGTAVLHVSETLGSPPAVGASTAVRHGEALQV